MKTCGKCKLLKANNKFYARPLKDGSLALRSYCIECGKADRTAWRAASPKDNDRNKAYNKAHADEIRAKKLVKNYWPDMTWQQALAEWQRMYKEQGGLCAFGHKSDKLHVDHCHSSGKVRGLLCYNCNNGIGRLKDDITVLEKAIDYLKKHKVS